MKGLFKKCVAVFLRLSSSSFAYMATAFKVRRQIYYLGFFKASNIFLVSRFESASKSLKRSGEPYFAC